MARLLSTRRKSLMPRDASVDAASARCHREARSRPLVSRADVRPSASDYFLQVAVNAGFGPSGAIISPLSSISLALFAVEVRWNSPGIIGVVTAFKVQLSPLASPVPAPVSNSPISLIWAETHLPALVSYMRYSMNLYAIGCSFDFFSEGAATLKKK